MSSPTRITAALRRQRGMTEEAANAAVDQACRRLRLPTMRAVMDEAVRVAEREQMSYQGFLAELLLAECDDRDRRSVVRRVSAAGFPRQKWLGTSISTRPRTSTLPRSTPSRPGSGSASATPSA